LLRLDVREFYHLRPFVGFIGNERAELVRRHRLRFDIEAEQFRFDIGIADGGVDAGIELLDNLGGRSLWSAKGLAVFAGGGGLFSALRRADTGRRGLRLVEFQADGLMCE
jgi:hypothetical protein